MRDPIPDSAGAEIEDYFNAHSAEIESDPMVYASFQKMMVRRAMAERPALGFCDAVAMAWPR